MPGAGEGGEVATETSDRAREPLADLRVDVEIIEVGGDRLGELAGRADQGDVVDGVD